MSPTYNLGEKDMEHTSDWFPGRVSNAYKTEYGRIKWDKDEGIAKNGKARESTGSRLLKIDEVHKMVKVPVAERNSKNYRIVN